MARGARPSPSPVEIAVEQLAKLSGAGTGPARMERAARRVVSGWRETADPDIARRWTGELLADIAAGLAEAEEQAGNVDESEPGAAKHAKGMVDGLQATHAVLKQELDRQDR